MFEYLMPLLVMPNYENTLLDRACKAAVRHCKSNTAIRAACRGVSPNRATTRTDVHQTINTAPSACRVWV